VFLAPTVTARAWDIPRTIGRITPLMRNSLRVSLLLGAFAHRAVSGGLCRREGVLQVQECIALQVAERHCGNETQLPV